MQKFKIEYFTDPLCCWSWAFEPQLRKLRFLLRDRLEIRYVMGGLLREWNTFNDKMNDVHRPTQYGPVWMEARNISGQPLDEAIWLTDPVDTSYPACLAVKAAELQSVSAGEAMLRRLRESVMMERRNIGEMEVLMEIAAELEDKQVLELEEFREALVSKKVTQLFQKDLDLTRAREIGRFPSLLVSYGERTFQITGYRPFSVLQQTFELLDPQLKWQETIDVEEYRNSWAFLTARELEEITAPAERGKLSV